MDPNRYFLQPQTTAQKQYCALAAFFKDGLPAKRVAQEHGYTLSAFYSLVRNFRFTLKNASHKGDPFFKTKMPGRKTSPNKQQLEKAVVALRGIQQLSVPEIQAAMGKIGRPISQAHVWRILRKNGFSKLPRRSRKVCPKGQIAFENPTTFLSELSKQIVA